MRLIRVLASMFASVILAANMTAFAAGVGQVSSFEFDFMPYDGFTTTFVGTIPSGTPNKRLVRIDWSTDRGDPMIVGGNFTYDNNGNILSKGGTKTFKYDKDGHVIWSGDQYSWCDMEWSNGKLVRETYSNKNGQYGASTFTYEGNKLKGEHSEWALNGGHSDDYSFLYDENGNLIQQGNSGNVRNYTYDTEGRLISVHIDRGSNQPLDYLFTYDNDGYLSRITQLHYDDNFSGFMDMIYETIG